MKVLFNISNYKNGDVLSQGLVKNHTFSWFYCHSAIRKFLCPTSHIKLNTFSHCRILKVKILRLRKIRRCQYHCHHQQPKGSANSCALNLQGNAVTLSFQMSMHIMFANIICSFDVRQDRLLDGSFAVWVNKNGILVTLTNFAPRKIDKHAIIDIFSLILNRLLILFPNSKR